MNTETVTCKCRKFCNGGRSAIVPSKLLADLDAANGGRKVSNPHHYLVANAHDSSNMGRLMRERLSLQAVA